LWQQLSFLSGTCMRQTVSRTYVLVIPRASGSTITCASIVIDHYSLVEQPREDPAVGGTRCMSLRDGAMRKNTFEIHAALAGRARMGNRFPIAAREIVLLSCY